LFSWGNHESGKLGLGFLGEDALFPVLIHHTEVDPVEKVVCGWDHSIALSRELFA
jgi:alpha-tubulin suppressor-like RCC1 family protein